MKQSGEILLNGQKESIHSPLSLAELLKQFRIDSRHLAVVVNNEIVPRSERGRRQIEAGDTIEVIRAVQGG
ncbi:MAG: sulfur carrier protein ThiS [Deltaproteobacteria bacterium]|nr:sulfur carrier protein ThiS [Deltaproteobacteria bacterium]